MKFVYISDRSQDGAMLYSPAYYPGSRGPLTKERKKGRYLAPTVPEYVKVKSHYEPKTLFIWSRVRETTLPLETTLRSVYMEL